MQAEGVAKSLGYSCFDDPNSHTDVRECAGEDFIGCRHGLLPSRATIFAQPFSCDLTPPQNAL